MDKEKYTPLHVKIDSNNLIEKQLKRMEERKEKKCQVRH